VVDADPEAAVPWLATACVPGPSLAEAVEEHGVLPVTGVVHRDLKPSNVLLAPDGPRVIDFGISRAVETSMLTQSGSVMGSP
jgi:serine/threonine protein kinase